LSGQPAGSGPRLPGTQSEIDAANYASLQEAIDALPATGGTVRLPAGTFELHEPLIIQQDDVRLVGQGTATHLVNRNEEGQPALHIRHRDAANARAYVWRVQLADFRITGN